jgi:hypothetical protein
MIPNICHYVFGLREQTEEFLFAFYLSVYSCYIVNNPDTIYFYYHYEPFGLWWDKIKNIPTIQLIKIDIPTHIGEKILIETAHKADKVRMDVLYDKGGIYLDIDTICVKPWNNLLNNKVVLGKESHYGICNAIMMTIPKSTFFKKWLEVYEKNFDPKGWNSASILLPRKIANENPDLLTLKESNVFFLPSYTETNKIFELNCKEIPDTLISLHLWESYSLKYLKEINNWEWAFENTHTLYGKIMLELINTYNITDK